MAKTPSKVRKRKPGGGRKKGAEPPRRTVAALKGSPAFGDWFGELVSHCRMPGSVILEQALIDYAKKWGFQKKAPER